MVEEVIVDKRQEEEAWVEEGLPAEHPTTPMAMGPSSAPGISPTRASSSSSRHYAKLLPARASQSSVQSLVPDQLNCRNHPSSWDCSLCQATWSPFTRVTFLKRASCLGLKLRKPYSKDSGTLLQFSRDNLPHKFLKKHPRGDRGRSSRGERECFG